MAATSSKTEVENSLSDMKIARQMIRKHRIPLAEERMLGFERSQVAGARAESSWWKTSTGGFINAIFNAEIFALSIINVQDGCRCVPRTCTLPKKNLRV